MINPNRMWETLAVLKECTLLLRQLCNLCYHVFFSFVKLCIFGNLGVFTECVFIYSIN